MNELEREKSTTDPESDPITDSTETAPNGPALQPGLRDRVKKFLNNIQQREPVTKQAMAKDRTRSLALLIGGTVGAVLLFLGVFSTPPTQQNRETSARSSQTLGRPANRNEGTTRSRSSGVPLLNADLASNDAASEQISPADIQGTSHRSSPDESASRGNEATIPAIRTPSPPARNLAVTGGLTSEPRDPVGQYRLNSATGGPTYSYGAPATSPTWAEPLRAFSNPGTAAPPPNRVDVVIPAKSSIVFMRSSNSTDSPMKAAAPVNAPTEQVSLLSPGTRLVARLEGAATTAVKTPIVASVEYNYERDGTIVVPAGAKIFGEVQQASAQGYLSVRFQTLQMPNGMEEKIEGAAMGLDQKPLKGDVSGKNSGKKFVTRTLSGVGTVAAYVVGAGGAGLSRTITGETLLRDRLASNVALAGEQELMNAAYSQNITVTVPANTRFYVVLQKPAMNAPALPPARSVDGAPQHVEIPTPQELRELMDLRREINRMYQESNGSGAVGTKP